MISSIYVLLNQFTCMSASVHKQVSEYRE
jgi:hypothetical protein